MGMPGEIVLFHALGQFRIFLLNLQSRFEPVATGGNPIHSFLIERIGQNIRARHAVTRFGQQSLNAAGGVIAKIFAVGAAKNLVDFRFERDIHCILRFLDDGIDDDKTPAVLEHAQHFADQPRRVAEMMQAERHKRPLEGVCLEWQFVRLARALHVIWNWILMLMTDIEHRQRLIHADNLSVFEALRERPRDPTRARRQIEHQLAALEDEHLNQLVRQ